MRFYIRGPFDIDWKEVDESMYHFTAGWMRGAMAEGWAVAAVDQAAELAQEAVKP
jgi:hypothetical protein